MGSTTVTHHVYDDDDVTGHVDLRHGVLGRVWFGVDLLLTLSPRGLAHLEDTLGKVREAMRKELLNAWANAHPEQPTPVERFGCCALCHQQTGQLFAVRVPLDYSYDTIETCAACSRVEHADELADALRLTEDETPSSVREDMHDDGMDDVPVDHKLGVHNSTLGARSTL